MSTAIVLTALTLIHLLNNVQYIVKKHTQFTSCFFPLCNGYLGCILMEDI